MPITVPTIQEIIDQVQADLQSRITDPVVPAIRNSNLDILSRVLGGGLSGNYQQIEFAVNNVLFINTAVEFALLEFHAPIWGVIPGAGFKATGNLDITGLEAAVIPTGTTIRRLSDDLIYVVTENIGIVAGVANVPVDAAEVGDAFNSVAGTAFQLVSSVTGIDPNCFVDSNGITLGDDAEEIESIRRRILDVTQFRSSGGKLSDYTTFVANAGLDTNFSWIQNKPGGVKGTVKVFFMMLRTSNTSFDPVPTGSDVTIVDEFLITQEPAGIDVEVTAPLIEPKAFTISGLSPTGAVSEAAVIEALKDLFDREANPNIAEAFSRQLGLVNYNGTILLSHIYQALASVTADFTLDSPTTNITVALDSIATVGTVTFV